MLANLCAQIYLGFAQIQKLFSVLFSLVQCARPARTLPTSKAIGQSGASLSHLNETNVSYNFVRLASTDLVGFCAKLDGCAHENATHWKEVKSFSWNTGARNCANLSVVLLSLLCVASLTLSLAISQYFWQVRDEAR